MVREPNIKGFRRVLLDVREQRKRPMWPIDLFLDGLAILFPLRNLFLMVLLGIKANVG